MYCECFFVPPSMNSFDVPVADSIRPLIPYSTIEVTVSSRVDHVTTISSIFSENYDEKDAILIDLAFLSWMDYSPPNAI